MIVECFGNPSLNPSPKEGISNMDRELNVQEQDEALDAKVREYLASPAGTAISALQEKYRVQLGNNAADFLILFRGLVASVQKLASVATAPDEVPAIIRGFAAEAAGAQVQDFLVGLAVNYGIAAGRIPAVENGVKDAAVLDDLNEKTEAWLAVVADHSKEFKEISSSLEAANDKDAVVTPGALGGAEDSRIVLPN